MPTPQPSNPKIPIIHQDCTKEIFEVRQVWLIEVNKTEHFALRPFIFLCRGTSRWVTISTSSHWGLCLPAHHRDWVVCSLSSRTNVSLNFDDTQNHSKYFVFPRGKGEANFAFCLFCSQYLLLLPAHAF